MKAKEIKQLRVKLRLTQAAMAKRVPVARETLCRWENGVKPLPIYIQRLKEISGSVVVGGGRG